MITLSDFAGNEDPVEIAVKKAEAGFPWGRSKKAPGMVFYNFNTGEYGAVQRGRAPRGVMTFYQCTVEEIKKIVKYHIGHPDVEREVNYS